MIRTDDGEALSAEVTNTDPAYERRGHLGVALETFEPCGRRPPPPSSRPPRPSARPTSRTRSCEGAARILDASEVNAGAASEGKLPGNLILTRDGGDHLPALQPIAERFGMPWGCFVEMPVERGISIALGMQSGRRPAPRRDRVRVRRGGAVRRVGEPRGRGARRASRRSTSTSRDPTCRPTTGEPKTSATSSPRSTARSSARCLPRLAADTVVAVTADHATSCVRRAHTADPVPLLASGGRVTRRRHHLVRRARVRRRIARPVARAARSCPRLELAGSEPEPLASCGFLPRFDRCSPAAYLRKRLTLRCRVATNRPKIRAGERRATRRTGRRPRVTSGTGNLGLPAQGSARTRRSSKRGSSRPRSFRAPSSRRKTSAARPGRSSGASSVATGGRSSASS